MDIRVPHRVIYQASAAVPVADVVESLLGAERLAVESAPILADLIPGLTIEDVRVSVSEISQQSPLRELFFISLAVAFQKDLEHDVPQIVHDIFGITVPDQLDSVVALTFCVVLFFAAQYLYERVVKSGESSRIRLQLDALTSDLAKECRVPEEKIRGILEKKFGNRTGMLRIARAAVRFFRPSKNQSNAAIEIGSRHFGRDLVEAVPGDVKLLEMEPQPSTAPYPNVRIELHAQDVDRTKSGWAAVIPEVSPNRMKMELYPPITPADIYTKTEIRGDVILVSRPTRDGIMEPYMFHLVRLID